MREFGTVVIASLLAASGFVWTGFTLWSSSTYRCSGASPCPILLPFYLNPTFFLGMVAGVFAVAMLIGYRREIVRNRLFVSG